MERKAKKWIDLFTSLKGRCDGYAPDKVTPYMHIMALHLKKVITNHGNLYKFSCQGMSVWYIRMYTEMHMLKLIIRHREEE